MSGLSVSELRQRVLDTFDRDGVLGSATEAFQPRTGQTEMALAVAETVVEGGALVVEAGTGVGKTFAYLVPALLSGERVLLSTATKALQDQLFARDIPRLVQALDLPVRLALLKGRASYLCTHRMELARRDALLPDRHTVQLLARVETWAQTTQTGDLAELPGLDERSPLIPLVTSNRDNCLGSECPKFKGCHVNAARREALSADVVVINHHLFFADLAVRESGMAELLPTVRVVIFDEAHQLNETGVQFLGQQLGSAQLIDFTRDLLAAGLQLARGLVDWQGVCAGLDKAARDLRLVFGKRSASVKLAWREVAPEGVDERAWQDALLGVAHACTETLQALDTVSEMAPDFVRLGERAQALCACVHDFLAPVPEGCVRWADVGTSQLRLMQAPLDIADTVRERLLAQAPVADAPGAASPAAALPTAAVSCATHPPRAEAPDDQAAHGDAADDGPAHDAPIHDDPTADDPTQSDPAHDDWIRDLAAPPEVHPSVAGASEAPPRAWVFTSATLGDDPRLRWFTEPCGLAEARVLRVGSPFDYARQGAVYVPRRMVRPSEPGHSDEVALLAARGARILGGRTLVLTTTLRALKTIGEQMTAQLDGSGIDVLVQGEWPKRHLMERFRAGAEAGQPGCVLVASATFWEGFDVPGEALQLVVIDKLPFPPPNDPVVEARSRRLEAQGRSPFNDYFVPEAVVALKQGAGRLIRRESDRGALVICDNRLVQTGYGRRLLAALPPMRLLNEPDELKAELQALRGAADLTRTSTTTTSS